MRNGGFVKPTLEDDVITTQKQVREQFWASFPSLDHQAREAGTRSKPQNEQHADTRVAFIDFVEWLHRDGRISDALANRVTL